MTNLMQTLKDIADIVMGQSPAGETYNRDGEGLQLLNGPTEFGPTHLYPTQFTTAPKKTSSPEIWDLFPDAFDDKGKPEGWDVCRLEDLLG